jgi:hypothetical protein
MPYKGNGILQMRRQGEDRWSSPDRDIIELWPSAIVRGAAFCCEPNGSLCQWLKAEGHTEQDVRATMRVLMEIINDTKFGSLEEGLAARASELKTIVVHAIMAAAGMTLFKDFNYYYRASRFTDQHGGSRDPMEAIDVDKALNVFDQLLGKIQGS